MATTDTVLQPGSEDLTAFIGPAGPQGVAGPTGPTGASTNVHILSLLVTYNFTGAFSYADASTTHEYLISGGTKFRSTTDISAGLVTGPLTGTDIINGTLSGFLATPTDPFAARVIRQYYKDNSGNQTSLANSMWRNVEIYGKSNDEIKWRLVNAMSQAMNLQNTAATMGTFEFLIEITA